MREVISRIAGRKRPVILVADASASMSDEIEPGITKTELLNRSTRKFIAACRELPGTPWPIHFTAITFGNDEAHLVMPLTHLADVEWPEVAAIGNRPIGAAFTLLAAMLEDRAVFGYRDYRPLVILTTNGDADDDWRAPLDQLNTSSLGRRVNRLAAAIGNDADLDMLKAFVDPAIASPQSWGALFDGGSGTDIPLLFKAALWLLSNPNGFSQKKLDADMTGLAP
jgi:uncharacterized protein YegL